MAPILGAGTLLGTSLGFVRGLFDSFDLGKATILWVLLPLLLLGAAVTTRREECKPVIPFLLFGVAAAVVTATSMRPVASLFGQYQRQVGLLTVLGAVSVGILAYNTRLPTSRILLIGSMAVASCVCAFYGFLQVSGFDPWTWSTEGMNRSIFGTLGNPNTSSGFVAVASPILVFFLHSFRRSPVRSMIVGALLGLNVSMLGVFESFQANVALLPSLALLAIMVFRATTWRRFTTLGLMLPSVVVTSIYSRGSWDVVASMLGIAVLSGLAFDRESTMCRTMVDRLLARRNLLACSVVVFVASSVALVLVIGPRLSSEFAAGFAERGDFYRTAISVLREFPLVGSGLDTFGYLFSEYRPAGHALNLETNRTSSVHSIPLGMFASGGILLGVAYLAIVLSVTTKALRVLRSQLKGQISIDGAISLCWLASLLQSSVSVDHVALYVQIFALAGMVLRSVSSLSRVSPEKEDRRRGSVEVAPKYSWSSSERFGLLGGLALCLILSPLTSRPARADNAGLWTLRGLYSNADSTYVLGNADRAVELAPWETQQRIRAIQAWQSIGDPGRATELAKETIVLSNYNPAVSIDLCYLVASNGDVQAAASFVEIVATKDPLAPTVQFYAADLLRQIADSLLASGDPDGAAAMLDRARAIDFDIG